jgi:hypothetical protein
MNTKQVTVPQLAGMLNLSVHAARKILKDQRIKNEKVKHGVYKIYTDSLELWEDKKQGKFRRVRTPVKYVFAESLDKLYPFQEVATKLGVTRQYVHHLVWYLKLRKFKYRGVVGTFLLEEDVIAIWRHVKRKEKPPLSAVIHSE